MEQELILGILNVDNTKESCHWFKRTIDDLREHCDEEKACMFMDIYQGKVDNVTQGFLSKLW
jgi:hypothetical protein